MSDLAATTPARVVVTGGHGLIGRHVVAELARAGSAVIAPFRSGERHGLDAETPELDLTDTDALTALLGGVDAVVHLAARSGGIQFQGGGHDDVLDANRRLSRSVFAACADAGVPRVFVASSGVVYRPGDEPIDEGHPVLRPADGPSGYAWSKLTDEAAAGWALQRGAFEPVIGRFSNVFGTGASFDPERSTVVHALVRRAAETEPGAPLVVWGDGSAIRSFIHVSDAARAVVTILERGEAGAAYNIDSGIPVSIRELATTVRDVVEPSLRLEFDATKPGGAPYRVLAVERLRRLGFEAEVDLASGVADVLEAWWATE